MNASPDLRLLSYLLPCEWRVLLLLAETHITPEIAEKLFLSKRSVEDYRYQISSKLEISGAGNLARFAWKNKDALVEIHRKFYPPLKYKISTIISVKINTKYSIFTISEMSVA